MTSTLPKIAPLVLKRRAAAFDNPDYLYELKYDGFRALLEIDGGDRFRVTTDSVGAVQNGALFGCGQH
jgi:ATP-dependent DNA ligase